MRSTIVLALLVACTTPTPTPTGTVCAVPDPGTLTYDNFGKCHASTLPRSKRNGAPLYHDFDSLLGILEVPDHIDQQAGSGPNADNNFMPGHRCPTAPGGTLQQNCAQPTEEERQQLAEWIACERLRPHTF